MVEHQVVTSGGAQPLLQRRGLHWLLCLLLLAFCVFYGVRFFSLMMTEAAKPQIKFPGVSTQSIALAPSLYPDASGRVPAAEDKLSEARINAKLMGVLQQGSQALASISLKGKKEKVFRVGDKLESGVTLEKIEPSWVVLRERGVLRRLSLASLLDKNAPISVNKAANEELKRDLQSIQASMVLTEDGVSGLRIDQLSSELESLNIVSNGDVVIAVDGVGLASLLASGKAVQELMNRPSLNLSILRDKVETSVDVDAEIIRSLLDAYQ